MKTILHVLFAATTATMLTACALLQPLDADTRRTARIVLTAYEATQQAILIYGRLPDCEAVATRLCKDRVHWQKIKTAEAAATQAIAQGTSIVIAIEDVNTALIQALSGIRGDTP